MARYANPFYNGGAVAADPMAGIGASLATALFGNPQLAAQQRLQQSQIRENEAQARNADSTADARNLPVKAQGGLADAVVNYVTSLRQPPSVPHGTFSPPAGAGGDTITVQPGFEGVAGAIANALPAETGGPAPSLVPAGGAVAPTLPVATAAPESTTSPEAMGALAQLIQLGIQSGQGEHLPALLDLVDAHAGNDETARRGMVGAGHAPGADFALTPDRADAIALARADSGANAMAREQVQSGDRRRGQDVAASTTRRGQDVGASTTRRGQDVSAATTRRGQDVGASTTIRGQDIAADTRLDVAGSRATGIYQSPIRGRTVTVPGGQYGAPRSYGGHAGDDLAGVPVGTAVHPMADGRVISVTRSAGGGNQVEIQYLDGSRSRYLHLADGTTSHLQVGQEVGRNDVVGGVGNTGTASHGAHLHVEYYLPNGQRVDPASVINQRGRGSSGSSGGRAAVVSASALRSIDAELDSQGVTDPSYRAQVRAQAATNYQQSRNPIEAVRAALNPTNGGAGDHAFDAVTGAAERVMSGARSNSTAAASPAPAARSPNSGRRAQAVAQLATVYANATPDRYPGLFRNGQKIPLGEARRQVEARFPT